MVAFLPDIIVLHLPNIVRCISEEEKLRSGFHAGHALAAKQDDMLAVGGIACNVTPPYALSAAMMMWEMPRIPDTSNPATKPEQEHDTTCTSKIT
jgi:hypothetical protein